MWRVTYPIRIQPFTFHYSAIFHYSFDHIDWLEYTILNYSLVKSFHRKPKAEYFSLPHINNRFVVIQTNANGPLSSTAEVAS